MEKMWFLYVYRKINKVFRWKNLNSSLFNWNKIHIIKMGKDKYEWRLRMFYRHN
jgi:hypothetical protein